MEIYILREGKEIGPFSEETTQSLLKEGSVFINDLAWSPGMHEWIPLHSVLYPGPQAAPVRPPPPPPAAVQPMVLPPEDAEPATAKQKAFLSYMGIAFGADLTKDQAALLVNDAMESPSDPARLAKWNDERLRLHPELFAAEIQAKKDNRAKRFFEIAQSEGAEFFHEVTKAHCQVLVGYLDVRFPNWDAKEEEAAWNYFFPAITEKFPQLVNKTAKGRFKYPDGPKVAPELKRAAVVAKPKRKGLPVMAAVRGLFVGVSILIILAAGYTAYQKWSAQQAAEKTAKAEPKKTAAPATPAPEELKPAEPEASKPVAAVEPPTEPPPAAPAESVPTMAANPPPAPAAPDTSNTFFDPNAPTAMAAVAPPSTAPVTQLKSNLILTKPTEVQLPFGRAILRVGTPVKLVAQEGTMVRVRYGNDVLLVPITSTDLMEPAAATAPAAAAPAAPPPPAANGMTAPAKATPAPKSESLF